MIAHLGILLKLERNKHLGRDLKKHIRLNRQVDKKQDEKIP